MNNLFVTIIIILCLLHASITNAINTQIKNDMTNNKYLPLAEQYKNEYAKKEAHYKLVFYLKDKINKDNVHIYRFEPSVSTGVTLNHPHVTVIIDDNGKLKGFARLSEDMTGENKIDQRRSMVLAYAFLHKNAPDLDNVEYQWSAPLKEKIIGADGKETNANGIWVKYRDKNTGQYLWVILAPDESIMEFDRDIVWSFFKGGRVNQLWLRDEWFGKWLAKNKQ